MGFMDSRVSSLEIRGVKVTLFEDSYLTGAHKTYLWDTPDLGFYGDWARSIRIEPPNVKVLSGYLWYDHDKDGVQDKYESPLPDVMMHIRYDANNDGTLVTPPRASALTDADGYYEFFDLFSGNYLLAMDETTLPPSLEPTYDTDGTGTPHNTFIYLAPGTSDDKKDFGYWYKEYQIFLPLLGR